MFQIEQSPIRNDNGYHTAGPGDIYSDNQNINNDNRRGGGFRGIFHSNNYGGRGGRGGDRGGGGYRGARDFGGRGQGYGGRDHGSGGRGRGSYRGESRQDGENYSNNRESGSTVSGSASYTQIKETAEQTASRTVFLCGLPLGCIEKTLRLGLMKFGNIKNGKLISYYKLF